MGLHQTKTMENTLEQLHQEFINSEEYIKYLKELDEYSEKYVSL
jgi:hypothetical protein